MVDPDERHGLSVEIAAAAGNRTAPLGVNVQTRKEHTMRKLVVALAVAAVLLPAAALAGGWATVQLSSTPKGSQAGTPWVVEPDRPPARGHPARRCQARGTDRPGDPPPLVRRPADGNDRRLPRPRRLPARRRLALDDLGRLLPRAHVPARADRSGRLSKRSPHATGGSCDRDSGRLQGSAPPQAGIRAAGIRPCGFLLANKIKPRPRAGARRGSGAPSSRSRASPRSARGTRGR